MHFQHYTYTLAIFILCSFTNISAALPEETFLVMNGTTGKLIQQLGPHAHDRMSPCSSFKIVLSLMGYDAGILKDENNPVWDFQEGYDDYLASWKAPQTPHSWMTHSCIWYSQLIAQQLGMDRFQEYLTKFNYGNQDPSGGLKEAWICSSLKISPLEQLEFIQRLYQGELPVTREAISFTKALLFKEQLSGGWKLYGKTGWSGSPLGSSYQWSWFVGWIEKNKSHFPFVYQIRDTKIDLEKRVPRAIQLLSEYKKLEEAGPLFDKILF